MEAFDWFNAAYSVVALAVVVGVIILTFAPEDY